MTEQNTGALQTSLGLVEALVLRFRQGLQARVEGEIESTTPEILATDRREIAAEVPEGALVGRTAWSAEGVECSGCFLWFGPVGNLIGAEGKTPGELTEDEIRTLDQSLRINIEEGGEGDPPLDWSPLERVLPERIGDVLREAGIGESSDAARVRIRIGDQELSFLFFAAGEEVGPAIAPTEPAADASSPEAGPAEVGDPSDSGAGEAAGRGGEPDDERLANLEQLLDVRIPLTIRLGSTRMHLDEILRLTPGAIVELDQREDKPLEVLANGRRIARGEVVVVDGRFGLRITEIGTSEERLGAAG